MDGSGFNDVVFRCDRVTSPHVSSIGTPFPINCIKILFVSQEDILFASVSCTVLKNRHGQNTVVFSCKENIYILSHFGYCENNKHVLLWRRPVGSCTKFEVI